MVGVHPRSSAVARPWLVIRDRWPAEMPLRQLRARPERSRMGQALTGTRRAGYLRSRLATGLSLYHNSVHLSLIPPAVGFGSGAEVEAGDVFAALDECLDERLERTAAGDEYLCRELVELRRLFRFF